MLKDAHAGVGLGLGLRLIFEPELFLSPMHSPAFGFQPPAWSPPPPPMTSVSPDWKKPGAGAHKMAAKRQ